MRAKLTNYTRLVGVKEKIRDGRGNQNKHKTKF